MKDCIECNWVWVKKTIANGNEVLYKQCTVCLKSSKKAFKKSEVINFDELPCYDNSRDVKEESDMWHRTESRIINSEEWLESKRKERQEREEYLLTNEWNRIRVKILVRDNYLCQGCLTNRATDVHHKTYDHLYKEFMFELISLCIDCHSRYHEK